MPHVIAYTYRADTHSPQDTLLDLDWQVVNHQHPRALPTPGFYEHGLPHNLQDVEGNLVHPVFDTDEGAV